MAYITREDGERFVIPSYRDTLSVKKVALLKKEIQLLSTSYGEYITLQRKTTNQYEVAFSPEPGYLLGETVWNHFKRPIDLIYCEAIPNTSEAILVIVKGGSVYLDGSFPLDSIPEELVIFRTQPGNFDIYVYGDVPISRDIEEGKFSLDSSSVKSFTVLDEPAFPTMPVVKTFQLQLVDVVLKQHGIGVFPVKQIAIVAAVFVLLWIAWDFIKGREKTLPSIVVGVVNPYQLYETALSTPEPAEEIRWLSNAITTLYTITGWYPDSIKYENGVLTASMKSFGSRTYMLFDWAQKNNARVMVLSDGFYLVLPGKFSNRLPPSKIYSLNELVSNLTDKLSYIIPKNQMAIGAMLDHGRYQEMQITISFTNISTTTLDLFGKHIKNLPIAMTKTTITTDKGFITGTIVLKAYGSGTQ
jgi:hypothetical protein